MLSGVAVSAAPADASCKRFGFTVNDYGKDGPTKDAKELLDKHIAEWAAQNKIKDYKTGSKTVNCELFLNFVVFDEHTCTASANVCWNDGKGGSIPETAAATPEDGEAGVPPTPIRKAVAQGHDKKTAKADAKTATPPAAADAAPPSDTAAVIPPAETAGGGRAHAASCRRASEGRRDGACAAGHSGHHRDGYASEGPSLGAEATRRRDAGCRAGSGEERGRCA